MDLQLIYISQATIDDLSILHITATSTKPSSPIDIYLASTMNTMRSTTVQSTLRSAVRAQPRAVRSVRQYATAGEQKVPTTGQGASQPAKSNSTVDRHDMSQVGNLAHATGRVNQFAKRDPSLYPLSIIVALALGGAGYFFATKATGSDEPARSLQMHGMVQPWDEKSKHDTHPSAVAEFKYRHKTRAGHYEDSLPTLSTETVNLKEAMEHKYKAA